MAERSLDPSEVRARVLDEHEEIRRDLAAFTTMADQADRTGDDTALRAAMRAFLPKLEAHMALEDEILVPALMEADAFGDVRTDIMHAHHAAYREEAAALLADLDAGSDPGAVVRWARKLVADVQVEMKEEEDRILRADILRDDVITSGVGG